MSDKNSSLPPAQSSTLPIVNNPVPNIPRNEKFNNNSSAPIVVPNIPKTYEKSVNPVPNIPNLQQRGLNKDK